MLSICRMWASNGCKIGPQNIRDSAQKPIFNVLIEDFDLYTKIIHTNEILVIFFKHHITLFTIRIQYYISFKSGSC